MEKFRLSVVGADEDVPRLLQAVGNACGGRMGFVMRPRDATALLIHHVRGKATHVWRTDLGLAPSHAPELEADPDAVAAEWETLRAKSAAGPATLKGKWAGTLFCTDGTPRIELERKVAAYGTLKLVSKPDGRWTATFHRVEKWFGKAKQEAVDRSSLSEAITAGMGLVVGLVGEACTFRDTRRRNTVDADYATQHPYVPPKDRKDPDLRLKPTKRAAPPPLTAVPPVQPPKTEAATIRAAEAAEAEAGELATLAESVWGNDQAREILARSAKLIRHAEALVRAPSCSGKERTMAAEDVRRAVEAYTQARDAIERGETPDVVATLRRIAERVSLAATRAAKSCAAGQQMIGTAPRSADQAATHIARRETPPPGAAPPAPAARPRRARAAKAPAVDPEKDKLLLGAFADAIKQAAAEMGGGA